MDRSASLYGLPFDRSVPTEEHLPTLFGWLFVVSWIGVPWQQGFPMSLLAGIAMIVWAAGGRWRLLSAILWAALAVWVVSWFLATYG